MYCRCDRSAGGHIQYIRKPALLAVPAAGGRADEPRSALRYGGRYGRYGRYAIYATLLHVLSELSVKLFSSLGRPSVARRMLGCVL